MAEIIGTGASVTALLQLATQLKAFRNKMKSAQHDWDRYCSTLESLGHVRYSIFFPSNYLFDFISNFVIFSY
jgi:hypothetical protein